MSSSVKNRITSWAATTLMNGTERRSNGAWLDACANLVMRSLSNRLPLRDAYFQRSHAERVSGKGSKPSSPNPFSLMAKGNQGIVVPLLAGEGFRLRAFTANA